mgnify:CR=1 FL=1
MGIFAHFIFAGRWLQLPIYIGLIIAQVIYACKFLKSLWYLISNFGIMDDNTVMIAVLNLIDVVMIANLLTMVIVGATRPSFPASMLTNIPTNPNGSATSMLRF